MSATRSPDSGFVPDYNQPCITYHYQTHMGHFFDDRDPRFTDPRNMALPHPQRTAMASLVELMMQATRLSQLGGHHPLLDPGASFQQCLISVDEDPVLRAMAEMMREAPGSAYYGAMRAQMMTLRHARLGGRHLQICDALERLLDHTQLPDDIPARFLRLPYPMVYFEFGEHRISEVKVYNALSGEHVLEGCYAIEESCVARIGRNVPDWLSGARDGDRLRLIHLNFTGSPLGKDNVFDDAHHSATLFITDENRPVSDYLRETCEKTVQHSPHTASMDEQDPDTYYRHLASCLSHLMKAVLYLNSASARTRINAERSDLERRLARIGPKKRARHQRKLERTYDRIDVLPPVDAETPYGDRPSDTTGGRRKSPQTHWRRGHFHTVRFGPERREEELRYFPPTLVNPSAGSTPTNKPYRIK